MLREPPTPHVMFFFEEGYSPLSISLRGSPFALAISFKSRGLAWAHTVYDPGSPSVRDDKLVLLGVEATYSSSDMHR